jgi:hypothetical protein
MTVWLASIVGIVALTLLIDIIIPEGDSNKYIKGVLAAVTTLVLVQPIPGILNGSIDVSDYFGNEQSYVDTELTSSLLSARERVLKDCIENLLESKGVKNADVTVIFIQENDFKVSINLQNVVIGKELNHIFSSKFVYNWLEKELGIKADRVDVYGK